MAFTLRLFEPLKKPIERLVQAGLKPGQDVLEYGCGAGSFTIPAAQLVAGQGTVYALDVHPLAIKAVQKRARQENLTNIQMILSNRDTGLPDQSVNVVLLYDVLHLVKDKQAVLNELHRVLKPDGFLSADHEHTPRESFLQTMTQGALFSLEKENGKVFRFRKL